MAGGTFFAPLLSFTIPISEIDIYSCSFKEVKKIHFTFSEIIER